MKLNELTDLERKVVEIMRMNGGNHTFGVNVSYYFHRDPILSCNVTSKNGYNEIAYDFNGNIMERIHTLSEELK